MGVLSSDSSGGLWTCIKKAKTDADRHPVSGAAISKVFSDVPRLEHSASFAQSPTARKRKILLDSNSHCINTVKNPAAAHHVKTSHGVAKSITAISFSSRPEDSQYCRVQESSSGTFYSKWRLHQVEKHVLRLLSRAQARLTCPDYAPYKLFPLQQPAFDWADTHENASELRVFAFEKDANGSRSFIVTTYDCFWDKYQSTPPGSRHYYEIIRSDFACHLYFDLEYKVVWNPSLEGHELVDEVMNLVRRTLKDQHNVTFGDESVIELDSSTESKFSRHVIIRLPGLAFANNRHVGAFVQCMLQNAHDDRRTGRASLLVKADETGRLTSFVDLGVYTRNRSFRLFLSSKAGHTAVLKPTGRFPAGGWSHKTVYFKSLICNVQSTVTLLRAYIDEHEQSCMPRTRQLLAAGPSIEGLGSDARPGPSPYPQIDEFITSICKEGGMQGTVRSWILWDDAGVLLLNMKGNRFCGHINRQHKSNGIFYVVDFKVQAEPLSEVLNPLLAEMLKSPVCPCLAFKTCCSQGQFVLQ
eukprot:jgi/Botrbrau1/4225/Bobra.0044s0022.2